MRLLCFFVCFFSRLLAAFALFSSFLEYRLWFSEHISKITTSVIFAYHTHTHTHKMSKSGWSDKHEEEQLYSSYCLNEFFENAWFIEMKVLYIPSVRVRHCFIVIWGICTGFVFWSKLSENVGRYWSVFPISPRKCLQMSSLVHNPKWLFPPIKEQRQQRIFTFKKLKKAFTLKAIHGLSK